MHAFTSLVFFISLLAFGDAAILSSSQLTSCDSSTNNHTNLKCSQKLVVTLSLDNNQSVANEYIEVNLSQAINTTSQQSQTFLQPVTIEDFNSNPTETVILTDIFSCQDGQDSSDPTCGWQYDATGAKILNSQGYCCTCSFTQVIGVNTGTASRGNSCGLLNLGSGSASAHCLTFSPLWYSGFSVLNFQYYYTISINIIDNSNPTSSLNQKLSIGTQNTFAINSNSTVLAMVVGDLYPSTPPSLFDNYYLLVPTSPPQNPTVLEGISAWMLVNQMMFSLDGLSCDKIGVSYTAFETQSDACQQPVGSCLTSQIEDLYQQDLAAIAAGEKPQYLLSAFGDFIAYQNNTTMSLALIYSGSFTTLVTLEISADQLEFVTNIGNGSIDLALIQNFEAFSGQGVLQVLITNTGQVSAEFSLVVTCDAQVQPIQAQSFFLSPFQSQNITDSITVTTVDNASHSCEVILKNSIASILDTKIVNFTSSTLQTSSMQNSNATSVQNSTVVQAQVTSSSCSSSCRSFYDVTCFVTNSCWLQFAEFVIILTLLIIVLCCFCRFIRCINKCFHQICCCCCCCLKGSGKKKPDLPTKIEDPAVNLPLELASIRLSELRRRALTNRLGDYNHNLRTRQRELPAIAPMIKPSANDLETSSNNYSIISLDHSGVNSRDIKSAESCYAFINFDPEDEISRALERHQGFSISVLIQIKEDKDIAVIIPSTSAFVIWVNRNQHFGDVADQVLQRVLNAEAVKDSRTRTFSVKPFYEIFS